MSQAFAGGGTSSYNDTYHQIMRQSGLLHDNICCDACGANPIEGVRYLCKDCSENDDDQFDLCATCYYSMQHHTNHSFYMYQNAHTTQPMVVPPIGGGSGNAYNDLMAQMNRQMGGMGF